MRDIIFITSTLVAFGVWFLYTSQRLAETRCQVLDHPLDITPICRIPTEKVNILCGAILDQPFTISVLSSLIVIIYVLWSCPTLIDLLVTMPNLLAIIFSLIVIVTGAYVTDVLFRVSYSVESITFLCNFPSLLDCDYDCTAPYIGLSWFRICILLVWLFLNGGLYTYRRRGVVNFLEA